MRNGSGVARVSWRGKPVSLTGDGFLLFAFQLKILGRIKPLILPRKSFTSSKAR
jgi:hypothetical protein